jgi:transcription elongation factor GreA
MTASCFENFRDYRESAVWLFKNASVKPWFKKANIPYEKQLITLIHILDLSYREIENRKDTVENKKLSKLVYTILFKEELLNRYIDDSGPETILRIYTFINDVKDLDPADKMNLKNRITRKYPDFKFLGGEEKKITNLGLLATLPKYLEKQRQLANILEKDIPANSKEIEAAKQHSDLKENAEYTAARERQTQLNSQASKLSGEIDRAQIFDPSQVNTSKVSFGTKITLLNKNSGKREMYTILGPWESDPDNMIISYLSPFGGTVLNKAVGDEADFLSNEEKITYLVEGITSAL